MTNDQLSDQETMRLLCFNKAIEVWRGMTKNEQTAVRFGMFPAKTMEALDKEGYDGRLMAVALMDCAKHDGGMVA